MVYNVKYVSTIIILLLKVFGTECEEKNGDNEFAVKFNISKPSDDSKCKLMTPNWEPNVGDVLQLTFFSPMFIHSCECAAEGPGSETIPCIEDKRSRRKPSNEQHDQLSVRPIKLNKKMEGNWTCLAHILIDVNMGNNRSHVVSKCHFNIKMKEQPKQNNKAEKGKDEMFYFIGAGLLLLVIIALIVAALVVYFKMKAKIETLSRRMQHMDTGGNDNKRYSSTPVQKAKKVARLFGKKGSYDDIYETLEELQMGSVGPPTPPIENIPTLKKHKNTEQNISNRPPLPLPMEQPTIVETPPSVVREMTRAPPLLPLPVESKPIAKEPKLPPPAMPPPKFPSVENNRAGAPKAPLAPIPGNQTIPKQFKVSSGVASELDTIFKNRQNSSKGPQMGTLPSASNNKPQAKVMPNPKKEKSSSKGLQMGTLPNASSNKPQAKAMPHPKKEKSASIAPNSNTLPSPSVKRSLPEIKSQFTKEQLEPPQSRAPLPPSKPLPVMPEKPQVKPMKPVPTPPIKPMPKKPVPPLPTTHNPPQTSSLQTPNVPTKPPQQEPVYEAYEEEPLYNSDEEWTYESLPQYNIYSI